MNLLTVIQSFTRKKCLVDVASSAGRNIHILQLYYINNRPPVTLRPVGLQTTRHVLIQPQQCNIYTYNNSLSYIQISNFNTRHTYKLPFKKT